MNGINDSIVDGLLQWPSWIRVLFDANVENLLQRSRRNSIVSYERCPPSSVVVVDPCLKESQMAKSSLFVVNGDLPVNASFGNFLKFLAILLKSSASLSTLQEMLISRNWWDGWKLIKTFLFYFKKQVSPIIYAADAAVLSKGKAIRLIIPIVFVFTCFSYVVLPGLLTMSWFLGL